MSMAEAARDEIAAQGIAAGNIQILRQVHLKYAGTDASLITDFGTAAEIQAGFEESHRQRYGFIVPHKKLIVDSISVEAIGKTEQVEDALLPAGDNAMPHRSPTCRSGRRASR